MRRLSVLFGVVVSVTVIPSSAWAQQTWTDPFDGADGGLLKLHTSPFPNADWIMNRDGASSAEFREGAGRVLPGDDRAGSIFTFGGVNDDMVIIHKDFYNLNAATPSINMRVAWAPFQTTTLSAANGGQNFLGQIGIMNTFDPNPLRDPEPGILNPPPNVDDDMFYIERNEPFERRQFSEQDSFWIGLLEIEATGNANGGGRPGVGTTTVQIGLYNENGLITQLGSSNYTLEAFYNSFDPQSGDASGSLFYYNFDFTMTLDTATNALGYQVNDFANISTSTSLFDFGSIAVGVPEPTTGLLLGIGIWVLALSRRRRET